MKKLKTHCSLSEQRTLLEQRGLTISDPRATEETLFNINYYRLSGYLFDFRDNSSNKYQNDLTWDRLMQIYDFDRRLTRILLFALEDIEETLKTRISYIITSSYPSDPIIYLKPNVYRSYSPYLQFLSIFYAAKEKSHGLPFVEHHNKEYGGFMPMWVAVELLTMGNLAKLFDNLLPKYQKQISKSYNTGPRQFSSWIENLTYTRNHLAHYMRIYNFNFGRTPATCKRHLRTFQSTNMIFDQVFVMACMYSNREEWNNYILQEIQSLFEEYSDSICLSSLGFPENWYNILHLDD